jgi:hypothetical protein
MIGWLLMHLVGSNQESQNVNKRLFLPNVTQLHVHVIRHSELRYGQKSP